MNLKKIAIIGGGSFGTALAQCFSQVSKTVKVIEVNQQIVESVNKFHENKISLPNIILNKNIFFTESLENIIDVELVFLVVPTKFIRETCSKIKKLQVNVPVILCSKGFDLDKNRLLSDLLSEELNNSIFVLSGPSFAAEIARMLPVKVNIAGQDYELCRQLSEKLSSESFEIEAIEDYVGLQIAGALKNVLAIGCGILFGRNLGQNSIAKLIVQGIEDMVALSEFMSGKKDTFLKIGALGDIILTCTSTQSRNMSFGKFLADGGTLSNWKGSLVEGIFTAKFFENKNDLLLHTFKKIHDVIYGKVSVDEFLENIFK